MCSAKIGRTKKRNSQIQNHCWKSTIPLSIINRQNYVLKKQNLCVNVEASNNLIRKCNLIDEYKAQEERITEHTCYFSSAYQTLNKKGHRLSQKARLNKNINI